MLDIQKYHSDLQCTSSVQASHIPWAYSEKGSRFLFCVLSGQEPQHPPVGITRELKPQHTFLHRCSTSIILIYLKTTSAVGQGKSPVWSQWEPECNWKSIPCPRKIIKALNFSALKKYDPHCHHSWWQTRTASEQGRSPVPWVCWEHPLDQNAQREGILSIFLKSSSWLIGTVRKLHLGIYVFFIFKNIFKLIYFHIYIERDYWLTLVLSK